MRKIVTIAVLACALAALSARDHIGKAIYIPHDAEARDSSGFDEEIAEGWDPTKWDFSRMVSTENIALFWAPGFGDNIAEAPDLVEITASGDTIRHNMRVDLANLLAALERFYAFFRDTLAFSLPGSNADRYKMMVMLDYSLEGTAYGGTYDDVIGALWVAPNRIQDKKLNCLAHELGHSFQMQIQADGAGEAWGGHPFFEMASQWMLWQVNPDWISDEYYHLEAFQQLTHKAFLSLDNIYHSPYVLEYWAEKHGRDFIAQLFREGRRDEDPALTYMRLCGLTQQEFNDEMFDCYRKLLNFDFRHAYDETRPYACGFDTPLDSVGKNRFRIAADRQPEEYGFNAIKIPKARGGEGASAVKAKKPKVSVKRLSPENGCRLKWQLVEEPDCWYVLVMNAPDRHVVLTQPDEEWHSEPVPLPTIDYEITVK